MVTAVEYERVDAVARVWLNRPERLNAENAELVEALLDALARAVDERVGAVVLAGRGRAFCAGRDLTAAEDGTPERLQDVTRAVRGASFPVVAAVHGYALGAGCEFALCSDLVIAAEDAVFGFPEVDVGLSVTGGISHVLPLAVGLARAKELVLLGERFGAAQAERLGLVNRVVPGEDLQDEALALAQRLATKPAQALALAKAALDHGAQSTFEEALALEVAHARQTLGGEEALAAVARFRGRR